MVDGDGFDSVQEGPDFQSADVAMDVCDRFGELGGEACPALWRLLLVV